MVSVNVRVRRSTFKTNTLQRLAAFEQAERSVTRKAAAEANRVSKAKAKAVRPPAPPRKGRMNVPGALADNIEWVANNQTGGVALNRKRLDSKVPWWVVQEIGTGRRATIKVGKRSSTGRTGAGGGTGNTRGRPTNASRGARGSNFIQVESQIGRIIPGHLVWATGPGGQYTAPGGARNQQLHLRRRVKGAPLGPKRRRGDEMIITKEIKGKGFIKAGAREGFRDYKNGMVAAAKTTLGKPRRP